MRHETCNKYTQTYVKHKATVDIVKQLIKVNKVADLNNYKQTQTNINWQQHSCLSREISGHARRQPLDALADIERQACKASRKWANCGNLPSYKPVQVYPLIFPFSRHVRELASGSVGKQVSVTQTQNSLRLLEGCTRRVVACVAVGASQHSLIKYMWSKVIRNYACTVSV